ncbi:MAG: LamG-like jellyroll fold domain-containing protein [Limisphaerales bacterium]
MKLSFPSPEFDDTVSAVCHGSATEPEMRALNALLRSDPSARDEYLIRVELHARLASDPELFAQSVEAVAGDTMPDLSLGDRCGIAPLKPEAPRRESKLGPGLALAACLILLAAGVWGLWLWRVASGNGTTSTAVAMLTRTVDARWGRNTQPLRVGSALEPGRLRLESGLAQVVFYSGARVVMEGPTELQLTSPMEAVCPAGRLLAEVPQPARGFRLKTAQLNVVDLGTSFGIDATGGQTEVHVFKGTVEFSAGKTHSQSLDEGRAAMVRGNEPPRLMAANEAAFTSLFGLQKLSLASEAVRYDQWRVASARLNQDPSLVVHFDFENLGDSDWTLRNAAEKSKSVPEATMVGCQRAEGRWPEKQALEFQSVNDRVRLAVPGNFDSLTLSAWVRVKGLDRQFNSLYMCDGFAPGTIHWLIRNDGVLSLTVKGAGPRNFQILASPPVLTLDKFGMWTHLTVVLDGKAMQLVHYVNGYPVSHHALKLGPPYRLGSAELGNWNAQGGPNPAPSHIRNLGASLDEFELFSRALSDAEVLKLYAEGKPESDN